MSNLSLTVVLLNYNHARFLPESLEALRRQMRQPDELIICDDASTDDSVAVISSFLPRLRNARLIRNPHNEGIIKNLNRGLRAARGDLIYFASSDDVTYPLLFEQATSLLTAYPQAALFSAPVDIIDEQSRKLGRLPMPVPLSRPGFVDPTMARRLLMQDDGWVIGCTTVLRHGQLSAVGGFAEDLGSFCDGYVSRVLWLEHGACFSPVVLAAWRCVQAGYSWSQTVDLREAERLAATAAKKIAERSDLFPLGYAKRWKQRHLFGARRFALRRARENTPAGSPRRILRWIREVIITAWLFITLRPWDVPAVIRRRVFGA